MAAGRDGVELAQLAVLLHVQGAMAWLRDVGAPLDLGWQAASIAQDEDVDGAHMTKVRIWDLNRQHTHKYCRRTLQ